MSEEVFKTEGKRLLVLGGTSAKDIVVQAKRMGVYTIVADLDETNVSKKISDEAVVISTTDTESLVNLIKEKQINGVFSGPSEFNIQQVMKVCEASGLPFYATKKQWDICQDKATFKDLCRKFNVPVVPEYEVSAEMLPEELAKVKYPVVVKPVDACSSKGLSICTDEAQLRVAIPYAISASESGKFIVEKCITSDYGFGCRYIANDGEIYLSAVCDRYTVDEFDGKAHISAAAIFPSKKTEAFIKNVNPGIIAMFKSIGLANGTFFMQALVDQEDGQIYFHEMGLRLSGGLIYSMLEASCGYNDVQMMLRYALGGPMATEQDVANIDPYMHGNFVGSLTIPLREGVLGYISGVEEVRSNPNVTSVVQYYQEGNRISSEVIGTLMQHFCRVKMMTKSIDEYLQLITWIHDTIKVTDVEGNDMVYRYFDPNRIR
jgi:biotin carboxylase